jgi:predicted ester cyclase
MQRNRVLVGLAIVAGSLALIAVGFLLGNIASASGDSSKPRKTPMPAVSPAATSESTSAQSTSLAAHKAAVKRVIEEAFNQGNADVLSDVYSQDYVGHLPPSETQWHNLSFDDYKEILVLLRTSIPDLRMSEEFMIGEGNMMAVRVILHGTFASEFYDIPPTNETIDISFTVIQRFDNQGKIAEEWIEYDTLALTQDFGLSNSGS